MKTGYTAIEKHDIKSEVSTIKVFLLLPTSR